MYDIFQIIFIVVGMIGVCLCWPLFIVMMIGSVAYIAISESA